MNPNFKLDAIDEQIFGAFRKNGRRSNRDVGRELGLSEALVRKRLKRMVESGLISYGLVVDVRATEMTAFGWLSVTASAATAQVTSEMIAAMPQCALCILTSGTFNIRAYIYAKDLDAMSEQLRVIQGLDGVQSVRFRQNLRGSKDRHHYEYVILSGGSTDEYWPRSSESLRNGS